VSRVPAKPRIGTYLVALAAAYLSAAAVMSLVFASGPPPEVGGHEAELAAAMTLYRLGFVGATLLGPTLIGVIILLLSVAEVPAAAPQRWLGTTLLAAYLPFVTVSYSSQYTLLPSLLRHDPGAAALWYLHDSSSIPYALDLTGYAVLGLALIVLAPALRGAGGAYRWMSTSLLAVAGFSLAAFAFHALGAATAANAASAISAAFTVPFMLFAIRQGRLHRRSGEAGRAGSTDAPSTGGRSEAAITGVRA
jgi:MFS family permease